MVCVTTHQQFFVERMKEIEFEDIHSIHFQEFLVFGISGTVLSGYVALEYFSIRSVVLDPDRKQYSVYRGRMLTAVHHCHNIYIRLKSGGCIS